MEHKMKGQKPNIIYILADDMGYGDVSRLNENCKFTTPYLDKMCDDGMYFYDAHSTSAVCTPSRYSILTGRYNWRSRLKERVLDGDDDCLIEAETKTLPSILQDCGYRTLCVGKWHLGLDFTKYEKEPKDEFLNIDYAAPIKAGPINRGFDYFYGTPAALDMPPYVYIKNDRCTGIPTKIYPGVPVGEMAFSRPGPVADNFIHEEALDHLCDHALQQIEENKDHPFFLYFPLTAPHSPVIPTKKFLGKSGTNEYGDFVLHCDDVVGRVMAKLDELNLTENTIVVFTADNGCSYPAAHAKDLEEMGHYPSYIFKGYKANIYEGGHRVPYIISWKGTIPENTRSEQTVSLGDFTATIADLLDYDLQDDMAVDSFSNLPLWQGEEVEVRPSLVHQSVDGSLALRRGDYKLEMCWAAGSGGWARIYNPPEGAPAYQMYNLKDDIGETKNIIEENPELFESMKRELIDAVKNGRTTKGTPQKNHGVQIWDAVGFLAED